MFRRVAIFSLFLLLIISGGYFIGDFYQQNQLNHMETDHQHFHEMLNLTPAQLEKLIPIEIKFSEQKTLYQNQIRLANMALGDIMKKEKAYTPEVQAAVKKVHIAMGHLQEATLIHFFDMRDLLDDRQAEFLDHYMVDAMHEL